MYSSKEDKYKCGICYKFLKNILILNFSVFIGKQILKKH